MTFQYFLMDQYFESQLHLNNLGPIQQITVEIDCDCVVKLWRTLLKNRHQCWVQDQSVRDQDQDQE